MIIASFLLALAGLAAMGLSQPQHHGWLFHRPAPKMQSVRLHWSGLTLILLSLIAAMQGWSATIGPVGWLGLLSLAAALLLLARTYLSPPRR